MEILAISVAMKPVLAGLGVGAQVIQGLEILHTAHTAYTVIEATSQFAEYIEKILRNTDHHNFWELLALDEQILTNHPPTNLQSMSGEDLFREYENNKNVILNKLIMEQERLLLKANELSPQEFHQKFEKINKLIEFCIKRNADILKHCERIMKAPPKTQKNLQEEVHKSVLSINKRSLLGAKKVVNSFQSDHKKIKESRQKISSQKNHSQSDNLLLTKFNQKKSLPHDAIQKKPSPKSKKPK